MATWSILYSWIGWVRVTFGISEAFPDLTSQTPSTWAASYVERDLFHIFHGNYQKPVLRYHFAEHLYRVTETSVREGLGHRFRGHDTRHSSGSSRSYDFVEYSIIYTYGWA